MIPRFHLHQLLMVAVVDELELEAASPPCILCTIRSKPVGWFGEASHSTVAAGNKMCNCNQKHHIPRTADRMHRIYLHDLLFDGYIDRMGIHDPKCFDFSAQCNFHRHNIYHDVDALGDHHHKRNLLKKLMNIVRCRKDLKKKLILLLLGSPLYFSRFFLSFSSTSSPS